MWTRMFADGEPIEKIPWIPGIGGHGLNQNLKPTKLDHLTEFPESGVHDRHGPVHWNFGHIRPLNSDFMNMV